MAKRNGRDQGKRVRMEPDSHIRREIVAIAILCLGVLAALAYFQPVGTALVWLDKMLAYLLGEVRPLLFLALFGLGFLVIRKGVRGANVLGIGILVAATSALVHILATPPESLGSAGTVLQGGMMGEYLALPLYRFFGFWASVVILIALLLTSLSLLLPSPITRLLSSSFLLFRLVGEVIGLGSRIFRYFKDSFQKNTGSVMPAPSPSSFEVRTVESDAVAVEQEDVLEEEGADQDQAGGLPDLAKPIRRRRPLPNIQVSLELLEKNNSKPTSGDIRIRSAIIQKTLQNFGIDVEMGEVAVGPTVTQYTFRPAEGVKLSSITGLSNDLALALASTSVRIEAPIPGKSLVGVEVPNEQVAMVKLREILESPDWSRRSSPLSLALGKDVSGKPWIADIVRMPHLLVAGSTGSGKSVCLNTIIMSLLYQNGPSDLRFIMVDPKRVELPIYNKIPHLLAPVITDVKRTIEALRWAVGEMERRFILLQETGARDIKSYNERRRADEEKMPYLVFIIDELADLMVAASSSVEGYIIRLAQMARAVGIHLIIATQRPSVDVLTGLIKANITSRIAFAVASLIDSRTILDSAGAEKLLGRGDMLFTTPELSKPRRLQGAYISDVEIRRVVEFLKEAGEPDYIEIGNHGGSGSAGNGGGSYEEGDGDDLLPEAKQMIMQAGKASASLLQRRLKVGYARAARILDLLEAEGFIGPGEGAKPREILRREERDDTVFADDNESL